MGTKLLLYCFIKLVYIVMLFVLGKVTVILFYQTCVYSHALCLRNYLVE